jgi:hypothetical protein
MLEMSARRSSKDRRAFCLSGASLKKAFSQLAASLGTGEVLFLLGMILLYSGIAVLLSHAWARSACGIILVVVGLIKAREV